MNDFDSKDIQLTDEQISQHLDQIAAISQNARGTWFSLILVLLFSVIAVAGVEDKDFFVFGAGLSLPVIGYTVPVVSFFYAAPVIILGLYAYLHLYLLNLWHLLGELPCELPDGRQLEDAVYPWIATNAVISLKRKKHHRPFTWLTRLVVFLLVWVAAPGALFYIWWRSVVPHDLLLTSWTGALAGAALIGGTQSLWTCFVAISPSKKPRSLWLSDIGRVLTAATIASAAFILVIGELRSKGKIVTDWLILGFDDYLYSAQLFQVELVERPKDWLSYDEAFEKYKVAFSNKSRIELRKLEKDTEWFNDAKLAFLQERRSKLDSLKHQSLRGIDLRNAYLRQAFIAGADLTGANLSGANLSGAVLEQAQLNDAELNDALLHFAQLQHAWMYGAELNHSYLEAANMNGVVLILAELIGANMSNANMNAAELHGVLLNGAILNDAKLNGAKLHRAKLNGAKLNRAELNGAELNDAKLIGANLNRAELLGANMNGAELTDARLERAVLNDARLYAAKLHRASLYAAKLIGTKLDSAELYGAELNYSDLSDAELNRAELNGAKLNYAKLNNAELLSAKLYGADLGKASLLFAFPRSVDFSATKNLSQSQLNSMFAVGAIKLPARLYRPPHWPARELTEELAIKCWRRWRLTEIRLQQMANDRLSRKHKYEQHKAAGKSFEPHRASENIDCK